MVTRVVAVYMPKGGVGKSFLTGHLAAGLALAGRRVLAIDADPGQAQLSLRMGDIERRGDLLKLFRDGASDDLLQQHPRYENLFVVTADPQDVTQYRPTVASYGPYWPFMLRDEKLKPWLNGKFDYVLVDCGPGFESEVTTCVIQAATELWLPYAVEYESVDSYQNLINQLLPQARRDPNTFITTVIPNKLALGRSRGLGGDAETELSERDRKRAELIRKARTNDAAVLLDMLKEMFGDRMTPPVRMAEALAQRSAGTGELVWEMAPKSELAEDLSFVIEAIVEQEADLAHGRAG